MGATAAVRAEDAKKETGTISGTVTGADGKAVAGVEVGVYNKMAGGHAKAEGKADKPVNRDPAPFRPVMLSHAIEETDFPALDPSHFAAEWKWDGIRVQAVAGEVEGGDRSERFAAWRQFFEALAEQRPTVLVFEDLHWADDDLLDFVDHLVDWGSGVPLLVVCTARPELLDRRPGWGGGKPNALTLSISPLFSPVSFDAGSDLESPDGGVV